MKTVKAAAQATKWDFWNWLFPGGGGGGKSGAPLNG